MSGKNVAVKTQGQEIAIGGTDVNAMIALAIEKGTGVEVMERLMTIRTQLKQEYAKEQYSKAMSEFQGECPTIKKEKKGGETNSGKVAYYYAPIESIIEQTKDLIKKHGFSYGFKTDMSKGTTIKVSCIINHIAGHSETYDMELPLATKTQVMSAPQVTAATVSYGMRYAFKNGFGIPTGDDDNDAQIGHPQAPQNSPTNKPEQQTQQELLITSDQLKQIEFILGRDDLTSAELIGLKPYKTYTQIKAKQVIDYFAKKGVKTGSASPTIPAGKTNAKTAPQNSSSDKPDEISDAQKKLIKERIQASHLLYDQKDEEATDWEALGAEPEIVDEVANFKNWFETTLKDDDKAEMTLVIATWIGDSKRKIQSLHDKLQALESELRSN